METIQGNPMPGFEEAMENGEITDKQSWHEIPEEKLDHKNSCKCTEPVTGNKNSYVWITVKTGEGHEILYYHQQPIYMKKKDNTKLYRLPSATKKLTEKIEKLKPEKWKILRYYNSQIVKLKDPETKLNVDAPDIVQQTVKISPEEQVKHSL